MMCLGTETKLGERRTLVFYPPFRFHPKISSPFSICPECAHKKSPPHPTTTTTHIYTHLPSLSSTSPGKERGGGWKEEKERKQEYQINEKFSYRPRFRAFHASNNN